MNKKLFIGIALLLCLLLSVAAAEEAPLVSGDFSYRLLSDGTAEITRYTGEAAELTVPDTLDGIPVTGIGENAFAGCAALTSVTLPSGILEIGESAFSGCTALLSADIPKSVEFIGAEAFSGCPEKLCLIVDAVSAAKTYAREQKLVFLYRDCLLSSYF